MPEFKMKVLFTVGAEIFFQTGSLPLLLLLELIFFHETTAFAKLHNEPFLCFHVLQVQLSSDKIASFLSSAFDQVQTCSYICS